MARQRSAHADKERVARGKLYRSKNCRARRMSHPNREKRKADLHNARMQGGAQYLRTKKQENRLISPVSLDELSTDTERDKRSGENRQPA
ncbi:hypothetical protein RRG08_057069 [Elysia crispata]|uniref:Uncharacterized protein n=1 Tax=Elysia crispata TaxID=231223 RepID=A0AAE1ALZ6_9GAST|nr:hypothetical protein RRG08_057069 [Elysia crispata]